MTDRVPDIHGYTILSRLGKGGMAQVYLATQENLQRQVAIKVLHNANDKAFNSRFLREAHIVASLHHPAIITIYDIDEVLDGRAYLAMEYVAGGDLSNFRGKTFEAERAADIICQLASGLAVVHDKGIIHRDIKPANILFREDGDPVITDFGVAKEVNLDCELTHSGIAVGSPAYSSPEQAQCQPLDLRTDIYSLGVVWLEMLLGHNPFRGSSYAESVMKHIQLPVPTLPAELKRWQPVLNRMLAKEPRDRYADCHQLLRALDELAEQEEDTYIGPQHVVAAAGPRRRPWGMLVGAVFSLGLLAAGAFGVWQWQQHMQVVELLTLGEQRLLEGKLLLPVEDNADHFFRQVLLREPDNAQAIDGLNKVLQARIATSLKLAEQRLEEDQLLVPEDDGAVFYFRQVLGWSPANQAALEGLQRVAGRYQAMSEQAYGRGNYEAALTYIERGLESDPNYEPLVQARVRHEQRVAEAQRLAAQRAAAKRKPRSSEKVVVEEKSMAASEITPPAVADEQRSNPVKRLWSRLFD
jgi:serine/threonine-protein kinase PpkA